MENEQLKQWNSDLRTKLEEAHCNNLKEIQHRRSVEKAPKKKVSLLDEFEDDALELLHQYESENLKMMQEMEHLK